jgi:hypothetical protein
MGDWQSGEKKETRYVLDSPTILRPAVSRARAAAERGAAQAVVRARLFVCFLFFFFFIRTSRVFFFFFANCDYTFSVYFSYTLNAGNNAGFFFGMIDFAVIDNIL